MKRRYIENNVEKEENGKKRRRIGAEHEKNKKCK
jgi:hypothetical protein